MPRVVPERDNGLVDRLPAGVSFCVAAWCEALLDGGVDVRRAAAFHLEALRRSRLAD